MIELATFFSVFFGVTAALLLHDMIRSRNERTVADAMMKVSQQLDESITVQGEIRQFLVATKSAASATTVLAEEISNLVRDIANSNPTVDDQR
ncbi:MAG: hypothetical protein AB8B48_00970 [Pseudomonadales bacterium]